MEPEISLVVPTFNESGNIELFLRQACAALAGISHEILVVDDSSPDGTAEIVRAYASTCNCEIHILVRSGQRGLSGAVLHGFEASRGRFLGVMDADLSHDARILPKLVEAVRQGADVAVGSRRIPGGGADHWPWYRRLASDLATGLAKLCVRVSVKDPMSGFFIMRRQIYERVLGNIQPQGYKILLEILCRARPDRVIEIPYVFRDRHQGHSKVNPDVAWQYFRMLWKLRRT